MNVWFNTSFLNKFLAILIAGIFVVVTFACFTMAINHGHGLDVEAACETVMTLADNAVVQTGLVLLLLVVAAACLCSRLFNPLSLSDTLKRFQVFHSPPSDYLFSPHEHSYLRELFSSGLIHAKLHSTTA